jgi:hypothetical protein
MRKLFRRSLISLAVLAGLVLIAYGIVGYAVFSYDPDTDVFTDGWGRQHVDAPVIARWLFGAERHWPGWGWFLGDAGIMLGTFGLIYFLMHTASRIDDPPPSHS